MARKNQRKETKKIMKIQAKAMKTAHKIFKNSKTITWSEALKEAWKIILNPEIKIIPEIEKILTYRKIAIIILLLRENKISQNHFARILFIEDAVIDFENFEKRNQFVQELEFKNERGIEKFYLDSS